MGVGRSCERCGRTSWSAPLLVELPTRIDGKNYNLLLCSPSLMVSKVIAVAIMQLWRAAR